MYAQELDEDALRRINAATTLLPRVRDLRLLKDILERQPLQPGLADSLLEVEEELRLAEQDVVASLLPPT